MNLNLYILTCTWFNERQKKLQFYIHTHEINLNFESCDFEELVNPNAISICGSKCN